MYTTHCTRHRLVLLAAAVTVSTAVLGAPSPVGATPAGPPSAPRSAPAPAQPSDAQSAEQAKTAAIARVQGLRRVIADQTREISQLTTGAARAEQAYQNQLVVQVRTQAEADRATAARVQAQGRYDAAHRQFVRVVVASFEDGSPVGVSPTERLLVADDPSAALDVQSTVQMISNMQAIATSDAAAATVEMRRADDRVTVALRVAKTATTRLRAMRARAAQDLGRSRAVLGSLRHNLVLARIDQSRATKVLSTFLGGWSVADPAAAAAANLSYVQLAKLAASRPAAPAAAHWTPGMGLTASYRALRWIGTPYAWAGGGAIGPSHGVCAAGDAHNDCHVVGFDCSGLALFAWAPYQSFAHIAAQQYSSGRVHPGVSDLLPGDLVFWSDTDAASIHHVAVYVGHGNVVQAPQSGDIVRVTPLGSVSSGYFGATRPLT